MQSQLNSSFTSGTKSLNGRKMGLKGVSLRASGHFRPSVNRKNGLVVKAEKVSDSSRLR